jgi:hypothetical protein
MQSRRYSLVAPIILTLIAAIITALTFRNGRPIGWGDEGLGAFLYDPKHWLTDAYYAWDPTINLGGSYPIDPATTALLPLATAWTLLRSAGFPYVAIQALYIFGVLDAALLFWFWTFTSALTAAAMPRSPRFTTLAAFSGSVAAVINLYSATTYWRLFDLNISIIALVPFVLWLINKAFDGAPAWSLITEAALGFVLLSAAFLNFAYLVPVGILAVCYALWRTSWRRGRASRAWFRLMLAAVTAVFVDAALFLPAILSSVGAYGSAGKGLPNNTVLSSSSEYASLWNVARGMAVSPASALWLGKDPSWRYFYSGPLGIACGLLVLGVMALGLVGKSTRRVAAFGIAMFSVGILAATGAGGPTGALFSWCFTHIPGFVLFRIPYLAFAPFVMVGIGMAVAGGTAWLAGAVSQVSVLRSRKLLGRCMSLSHVIGVATAVLMIGYAFPLSSGMAVDEPVTIHGPTVSVEIEVPNDYSVIGRFLAEHDPGGYRRVLALPLSEAQSVALAWPDGYDGPDYDYLLLGAPSLEFLANGIDAWERDFIRDSKDSNLRSLIRTAGLLGCGYVLLQGDVLSDVYAGRGGDEGLSLTADPKAVGELLTSARATLAQLGSRMVLAAGELALYELPAGLVRPLFYALPAEATGKAPVIRASAVNPVEWRITATGGRGSWLLLMNAETSRGWETFVSGASGSASRNSVLGVLADVPIAAAGIRASPRLGSDEIMAGGISGHTVLPSGNSWREEALNGSTRTLILIFVPQVWRGVVNLVSVVGWFALLGVFAWRRKSRRVAGGGGAEVVT